MTQNESTPPRAAIARATRTVLAIALALGVVACEAPETGGEPEAGEPDADIATADRLTIADADFATPESVLHDEADDEYIVSNINGDPLARDGDGYLSRVTPDGSVTDPRWVDGAADGVTLNAPKGLAIQGDTLFVTDIDVVRLFDRVTGEPLGDWPVEGATFLNDATIGPDGVLYVTDSGLEAGADGFAPSGTDAIYHFPRPGQPVAIAEGPELTAPNGIIATESAVIVVPFGGNAVYRIDAGGMRSTIAELPGGQLDGIVRIDDATYLVSSWETATVYRVREDGTVESVVENVPSPADIGWDDSRDRVLIPLFTENQVEIRTVR